MNITSKQGFSDRIRREYEHLIRTESHDYAVQWVSIKLSVPVDEVNKIIDEVTA